MADDVLAGVVFDLHCDTLDTIAMHDWEPYSGEHPVNHGTLAANDGALAMERTGRPWAQNYAIWVPNYEYQKDPLGFYRAGAAAFAEQMTLLADVAEQVRDGREVSRVLGQGKVAAMLAVENAAPMDEGGLAMVDEFVRDGVKTVTLTWNGENSLGGGIGSHEGLSAFGREAVAAMERERIVVDCSHLSDESFADLLACAKRPFVATHSNARAICSHPRNLTDEMFRAIADRGGLVGLNYYRAFITDRSEGAAPADGEVTFDELAAHVEHWLDLGGEDVVALGSDFDGADVPAWIDACEKVGDLRARMVERLGEELVEKLFWRNALAFYERNETV